MSADATSGNGHKKKNRIDALKVFYSTEIASEDILLIRECAQICGGDYAQLLRSYSNLAGETPEAAEKYAGTIHRIERLSKLEQGLQKREIELDGFPVTLVQLVDTFGDRDIKDKTPTKMLDDYFPSGARSYSDSPTDLDTEAPTSRERRDTTGVLDKKA